MDIRQLKYFLAAIRFGTLRRAAEEHFVTQPAVSLQLKKLEQEVGDKLYVRRDRRIVPTETGRMVAERAAEIVQRFDLLERSIRGSRELMSGFLRIGNIDAASIYVLPGVFRTFHRKHRGVDIHVVVGDSDTLTAALASGAIELAIVTLPVAGDDLVVTPIYRDPMVLVTNSRHELATSRMSRRRALQTVAEQGLITYPAQSTTRRLIEKVFIDNGLNLRASMEMSSPEAIKRLTEAGLGASILPRNVVAREIQRGQLTVIPTGSARFSRMLGLVHGAPDTLSPPAVAFIELLFQKYKVN